MSLPGGTVGTEYSATLTADGGEGPYTWSVTDGALPEGLALAPGGAITGTPTAEGESAVTVRVADSNSLFASKAMTITVVNP